MAVPKKRHTKSARNQRRANKNLAKPTIVKCANCKSPKAPHRVCTVCGTYAKKQIIKKTTKKKK